MALQFFCDGVSAVFRREARLVRAIGDLGAFATVAVIIARQTEQGITLARVQGIVCGRLASTRRVRAMVDELARTRAVVRIASATDARQRPFSAGGWLMDALVLWLQPHIVAAYPWITALGGSPSAEPATVVHFLAGWVDLYERESFLLADGYPVVLAFMNHLGGYPFLLKLIGSSRPAADGEASASVSRKSLACELGLSRAHFTALLVQAERRGWMKRLPKSMIVTIDAAVHVQLRHWVARELAWTAHMLAKTSPAA